MLTLPPAADVIEIHEWVFTGRTIGAIGPIFAGETYMHRLIPAITQAIAKDLSDADYKLLHARLQEQQIPDHLPLILAVDYVSDIVRQK